MSRKQLFRQLNNQTVAEIFERFVASQTAKGVSDKTIQNYHSHLHSLQKHLDYSASLATLTKENLDNMVIKWDMNRHLCEKYSAVFPPERQDEAAHRYVLGVYALLERLTARYPELLIESCSGGEGRFDAGMLYYTPQIWCSDNTDPIARLEIQYGTSFCYPQSCISAHVSASPNHQTGRETALHTRFCVATAAGGFGYELDPAKLGADEKEEIARQIKIYQQYRDLFCNGDFYRLTETDTASHNAWMVVSPDRKMAIMTYAETKPTANGPERSVRLNGLVPELQYKKLN